MALSQRTIQRARYHLSYTQLTTPTALSLGSAVVTQAKLLLDSNAANLDPIAEPDVIATIDRLDCTEKQLDELMDTMSSGVVASGSTKFEYERPNELLELRYRKYQLRLADQLGTFVNPVSNQEAMRGRVVEGDW
jgi:hypothetical protein